MADGNKNTLDPAAEISTIFQLFNEIGIIEQLSSTLFQQSLPDGLLVSHFAVINHLSRGRDGHTPLQIAKAFQLPKTTMTHTLSGLEKHGLVQMKANPKDGRSKCVWLTEKGRAFRIQSIAGMAPDIQKMAKAIPPEQIAKLLPTLTKVREYLDAARD